MVVLKFGGKSLETLEKVQKVCAYIAKRATTEKLIVVVSAFGKTTDNLIQKYKEYGGTSAESKQKDMLISTGETQSAALVATTLISMGANATCMNAYECSIFAMGDYGSGVVTGINKTNLLSALKTHDIVVVTGFQAINSQNQTITLGRNGSDTSAVAIGSCFGSEVEIYSDFDGVFAGDPKKQNYKKIDEINYDDLQALSHAGSPVLAEQSVSIAKLSATPIKLKCSSQPNGFGSFVSNIPSHQTTITVKENLCKITINFDGNKKNLQKTADYITKNVSYISFIAKNNKIELIINQDLAQQVEFELAKLNNLLQK